MMTFIRPRLRKPLGWAIAGTILAAAWLVNGGHYGWMLAIVVEITMLVRAAVLYVYGAEDSDGGALAGSRADERQQLISQKSWALAGKVAYAAAFFLRPRSRTGPSGGGRWPSSSAWRASVISSACRTTRPGKTLRPMMRTLGAKRGPRSADAAALAGAPAGRT